MKNMKQEAIQHQDLRIITSPSRPLLIKKVRSQLLRNPGWKKNKEIQSKLCGIIEGAKPVTIYYQEIIRDN